MLRFIKDLPLHVVGVHATGKVENDDLERVLIPQLDDLVKRYGEINYLLVLETNVSNFSSSALWSDFKLGLKHYRKWHKIAIVTDQKWVGLFSNVFRFLIPGKTKGFPLDKLDEALQWVSLKE